MLTEKVDDQKFIDKIIEIYPEAPTLTRSAVYKFFYEPQDQLYRLAIVGKDLNLVLHVSINHMRELRDSLNEDFRLHNLV